jgi:hypothetical protein
VVAGPSRRSVVRSSTSLPIPVTPASSSSGSLTPPSCSRRGQAWPTAGPPIRLCVLRGWVNSRVTGWLTHPDAIARLASPRFPRRGRRFRLSIAAALTHMRRGRGPARTGAAG